MWHSSGVQSDQSQDETASVPIGSSVTRGSISKLPPELILTILESTWDSTCFTNYDPSPGSSFRARTQILSRCSLVCKTWTEPAQSLLWSRIELDRRRLDVLSGMKPLEHDDDNGRFALRYPVMHIGLQWPLFGSNSDSSSRRTVDEEEERARPWVQRDIDRCAVLFANVQYSLRGLRIEVNSAVEGSQAVLQVLSFDSLRGLKELSFAHLEAGKIPVDWPIPHHQPPLLPFHLTSLTLRFPTSSRVVEALLPTLRRTTTSCLRHLRINLLVQPDIGQHTALPILETVLGSLDSPSPHHGCTRDMNEVGNVTATGAAGAEAGAGLETFEILHLDDRHELIPLERYLVNLASSSSSSKLNSSSLHTLGLSGEDARRANSTRPWSLLENVPRSVKRLILRNHFPLHVLAQFLAASSSSSSSSTLEENPNDRRPGLGIEEVEVLDSRIVMKDVRQDLELACRARGIKLTIGPERFG